MTLKTTAITLVTAAAALAGCGGGSALGNSPPIENPAQSGGRKLSFEYFQRCIDPIFLAVIAGSGSTNTCSASGCHNSVTGTGGALRIVPPATIIDLSDPAQTPDVVRTSDMYKNYYSSQGVTVIGTPTQSRLFAKPLLLNVLHGGGLIFASASDEFPKRIAYWISHPMPETQDEFGTAGNALFTPADPKAGACNTE
jgi:hypothetical protein